MAVRVLRATLLALFVIAGGCSAGPDLRDPLRVRSQHPAQLTILRMEADSAAALPRGQAVGHLDTAYSSLFLNGSGGPGKTFLMDGEYLRARLAGKAGLGAGLEFGFELPVGHTTGGFLDGFVIAWHDVFGLPDQQRDLVPKNQFGTAATLNGVPVYTTDRSSLELLDVPLSLKWNLVPPREGGVGLALRTGIELPVGDQHAGFGNGGLDYGVGMLVEWRTGPMTVLGHLSHSFVATPDLAEAGGLGFADVSAGGVGVVLPIVDGLQALAQVEWETSTLRDLGFDRVARDQVLLWIGGRARLGRGLYLDFALGEDISTYVAPDFSAFLGLTWAPGGGQDL